MKKIIKIGDIINIPLKNGDLSYGRIAYFDSKYGFLLQIYDFYTRENEDTDNIDINNIVKTKPLFPPVSTGVEGFVKKGIWKIIGNISVTSSRHPKFVSCVWNEKTGEAGTWYLWDGKKRVKIGKKLSKKQKKLEFLIGWAPKNVISRIETGKIPFPIGELINDNKYSVLSD